MSIGSWKMYECDACGLGMEPGSEGWALNVNDPSPSTVTCPRCCESAEEVMIQTRAVLVDLKRGAAKLRVGARRDSENMTRAMAALERWRPGLGNAMALKQLRDAIAKADASVEKCLERECELQKELEAL